MRSWRKLWSLTIAGSMHSTPVVGCPFSRVVQAEVRFVAGKPRSRPLAAQPRPFASAKSKKFAPKQFPQPACGNGASSHTVFALGPPSKDEAAEPVSFAPVTDALGQWDQDSTDGHVYIGIDPDLNGAVAVLHCSKLTDSPVRVELTGLKLSGPTSLDELRDCWQAVAACSASHVCDMPTEHYSLMSGKLKRRMSANGVTALLRSVMRAPAVQRAHASGRLTVILERPSPIPDMDGWQSTAVSAYGFGVWMGALAGAGMEPFLVLATHWKKHMLLYKASKDDSRALAADLVPSASERFSHKSSHGRAEALLLAVWGSMYMEGQQQLAQARRLQTQEQQARRTGRLKAQKNAIKVQSRKLRALADENAAEGSNLPTTADAAEGSSLPTPADAADGSCVPTTANAARTSQPRGRTNDDCTSSSTSPERQLLESRAATRGSAPASSSGALSQPADENGAQLTSGSDEPGSVHLPDGAENAALSSRAGDAEAAGEAVPKRRRGRPRRSPALDSPSSDETIEGALRGGSAAADASDACLQSGDVGEEMPLRHGRSDEPPDARSLSDGVVQAALSHCTGDAVDTGAATEKRGRGRPRKTPATVVEAAETRATALA